ncbi:MAG TPA: GxxExxY protein [Acetobacteraceae bacterium]|nr:GxxExxY protein [Acetobacteraceae bacterium]
MLLSETLTEQVIGLAIAVHRHTGPGLLESVYEQCLCVELRRAGVAFARQVPMPMLYKGEPVGEGFRADLVVAEQVILEIKSVTAILSVHEMQLRTYLRMSGIRVGLLLNFNVPRLMDGLRRYVV